MELAKIFVILTENNTESINFHIFWTIHAIKCFVSNYHLLLTQSNQKKKLLHIRENTDVSPHLLLSDNIISPIQPKYPPFTDFRQL